MANRLLQWLRGARRIELFAALALAALLALALLGGGSGHDAGKTELESRLERILSRMEGVGPVSAMVTQQTDGDVRGVLIVAPELKDLGVYLRVQRAVAALLETEVNQIEIIGYGERLGGVE